MCIHMEVHPLIYWHTDPPADFVFVVDLVARTGRIVRPKCFLDDCCYANRTI